MRFRLCAAALLVAVACPADASNNTAATASRLDPAWVRTSTSLMRRGGHVISDTLNEYFGKFGPVELDASVHAQANKCALAADLVMLGGQGEKTGGGQICYNVRLALFFAVDSCV